VNQFQKDADVADAADTNETFRIYRVVMFVAVACSLAIAIAYQWTRPMIANKQRTARQTAIAEVLPGVTTIEWFTFNEEASRFERLSAMDSDPQGQSQASHEIESPPTSQTPTAKSPEQEHPDVVFAGYDSRGTLVGVAVEAQRMGYQDVIRLVYGYSPADEAIIGVRVLESRETPGLGDRIETDSKFQQNFQQLSVALDPQQAKLAHPIEFVSAGTKTQPWQIDGISGATISSRAIAEMLRESTEKWVPRIRNRLDDFTRSPQGDP